MVQAVVMRDSWPTPDTAWPYISSIRSVEKLDDKQDTKPGSAKKGGRSKGAASKKGSVPSSTQVATANVCILTYLDSLLFKHACGLYTCILMYVFVG